MRMKKQNDRFCRAAICVLMLLFTAVTLLSCGASPKTNTDRYNYSYDMEYGYYGDVDAPQFSVNNSSMAADIYSTPMASASSSARDTGTGTETPMLENPEKLVYTADVSIETKTFDDAVEALRAQVSACGGITQSESYADDMPSDYYYGDVRSYYKTSGYKSFSSTVRIPTAQFQSFLDAVSGIGHLRSSSSYVENITQDYYNNKSYLDSYEAQLAVLQGMYEKAETIDEMITIETRIAEVQAQINSLTTVIRSMDRDVAYSTVNLRIYEVEVYSDTPHEVIEQSFWENVQSHFVSSFADFVDFLENTVYFLIDSMWGILLLALIAVVMFFLVRALHRRSMKKRPPMQPSYPYARSAPEKDAANAQNEKQEPPVQK